MCSSRRPKSAGDYSNVKSKLPSRDNIHHIPGDHRLQDVSTFIILFFRRRVYKDYCS